MVSDSFGFSKVSETLAVRFSLGLRCFFLYSMVVHFIFGDLFYNYYIISMNILKYMGVLGFWGFVKLILKILMNVQNI